MSEPKKCDAKWDKNDAVSDSDRKRMSEDECGSVCACVPLCGECGHCGVSSSSWDLGRP